MASHQKPSRPSPFCCCCSLFFLLLLHKQPCLATSSSSNLESGGALSADTEGSRQDQHHAARCHLRRPRGQEEAAAAPGVLAVDHLRKRRPVDLGGPPEQNKFTTLRFGDKCAVRVGRTPGSFHAASLVPFYRKSRRMSRARVAGDRYGGTSLAVTAVRSPWRRSCLFRRAATEVASGRAAAAAAAAVC
jgi:hypothetical protein